MSNAIKKIHMIGIKGAGMSALAQILKAQGHEVYGSDTKEHYFSDNLLEKAGILVQNFDAKNINLDFDLIIKSNAYNETNLEVARAKLLNLPIKSYSEILAEIFNQNYGIAICGSHGKSTTSALTAFILEAAAFKPSAVIGAKVLNWNSNARVNAYTASNYKHHFVIEADEYKDAFLKYLPKALILTNIDHDHPDYFPTTKKYLASFVKILNQVKSNNGLIILNGDDKNILKVLKMTEIKKPIKFGFELTNHFQIKNADNQHGYQKFEIYYNDKSLGCFQTQLAGRHNLLNCAAAISLAYTLRGDLDKIKKATSEFKGTARRLELIGEKNEALIYDDYAHHPTEIKATLLALRQNYPKNNLIVIFQPHTFSRTKYFLKEFARSFEEADEIIFCDVFASAREQSGNFNFKNLAHLTDKFHKNAVYGGNLDQVFNLVKQKLEPRNIILTMGAGDVNKIAQRLVDL